MARRSYAGGAVSTALTSGINSSALSFTVDDATNWPSGGTGPFWAVIGPGGTNEEKVLCASRSGNNITVSAAGRGADGTVAVAHQPGEVVQHVVTAMDIDESNAHVNSASAVHGITGAVVGTTDTQTLTNKTMSGSAGNVFSNLPQSAVTNLVADQTAQNNRLTNIEAKDTAQDSTIAALDTSTDNRLDAVEAKNTAQDTRLTNLEAADAALDDLVTSGFTDSGTNWNLQGVVFTTVGSTCSMQLRVKRAAGGNLPAGDQANGVTPGTVGVGKRPKESSGAICMVGATGMVGLGRVDPSGAVVLNWLLNGIAVNQIVEVSSTYILA